MICFTTKIPQAIKQGRLFPRRPQKVCNSYLTIIMPSEPEPKGHSDGGPGPGDDPPPPPARASGATRPHWVELVLGAALVVIGAFQVCIYGRQTTIMQTQANISADQLAANIADIRPWLLPTDSNKCNHAELAIRILDSRRTPARETTVTVEYVYIPWLKDAPGWSNGCPAPNNQTNIMADVGVVPIGTLIPGPPPRPTVQDLAAYNAGLGSILVHG